MKTIIYLSLLLILSFGIIWYRFSEPYDIHPEVVFDWKSPNISEPETVFTLAYKNSSPCFQTYLAFYSKDEIEIRILFGYKDARPSRFVGDRYEKFAFLRYLLLPCSRHFYACGFKRDTQDADRLFKEIRGPDGRKKMVRLLIVHSSIGPDDTMNRKQGFQQWQSGYAQTSFLEGLHRADAVLYVGHSRDGGGPDFFPPKLLGRHTHYSWYKKNTPGLTKLLGELKDTSNPPKLIGLYSCVSSTYFAAQILKVVPHLGLVTSPKLIYYVEAMKSLMGTLSALLGQLCEKDFQTSIQTPSRESQIVGFFRLP